MPNVFYAISKAMKVSFYIIFLRFEEKSYVYDDLITLFK